MGIYAIYPKPNLSKAGKEGKLPYFFDTLDTDPVLEAARWTIEAHGTHAIINSDQGQQFTSDDCRALLKAHGIRQSMDGKARRENNVIIERWFRSLKTEHIYINEYRSPRDLRADIRAYVRDYNELRPHQSHGYDTSATVYHMHLTA